MPWSPFSPDPAAVAIDNSLGGGKPDSVTWKKRSIVQMLKRMKKPAVFRHVKPNAVIPDIESLDSLNIAGPEFDEGCLRARRVFPGVLK